MATRCENRPLRGKDAVIPLSAAEVRVMQRSRVGERVVEPGTTIVVEGPNPPQLFTALRGLGLRCKPLESGERQVMSFVLPGDFVGLQAGDLGVRGHSVEAPTRMTLRVFDRSEIWTLFKNYLKRTFDLTWLAASEEGAQGEVRATVGQRTAVTAVAGALQRFTQRGEMPDLAQNGSMPLPYRQQDLGDALGLSLILANKTLAKLHDRQLALWSDGRRVVYDDMQMAGLDVAPARARSLI